MCELFPVFENQKKTQTLKLMNNLMTDYKFIQKIISSLVLEQTSAERMKPVPTLKNTSQLLVQISLSTGAKRTEIFQELLGKQEDLCDDSRLIACN